MGTDQSPPYDLVLAGCGKMGGAMLDAWLSSGLLAQALVIDPSGLPDIFQDNPHVSHAPAVPDRFNNEPDVIVLAVKPQILKAASQQLSAITSDKTLILSIAAGQTLETLESLFGIAQPVIRTMPNTPAAIGKGMSVSIANAHVTAAQKKIAARLLEKTGKTAWIDDESLMDAVTALSGSGPAYLFLLIEILTESGKRLGLPEDMAATLARQTVIGSAALAEHESSTSAAQLRRNVTSPGGTTEAALKVLMDGKMQDVFDNALLAARNRGKELNT